MTAEITASSVLQFNATSVSFFRASGERLANGNWSISTAQLALRKDDTCASKFEVEPWPISDVIQRMIRQLVANGKSRTLVYLDVTPDTAVVLFLEGCLQPSHLESATIQDNVITVPRVRIARQRKLTVQITGRTEGGIRLTNTSGRVLAS